MASVYLTLLFSWRIY